MQAAEHIQCDAFMQAAVLHRLGDQEAADKEKNDAVKVAGGYLLACCNAEQGEGDQRDQCCHPQRHTFGDPPDCHPECDGEHGRGGGVICDIDQQKAGYCNCRSGEDGYGFAVDTQRFSMFRLPLL